MHHIETAQPSWRIASPSAKQSDPAFAGFALGSSRNIEMADSLVGRIRLSGY
jgi:hypothetical protein